MVSAYEHTRSCRQKHLVSLVSNDLSDMRVRVPASTSNLGAGFDVLGLALNMYLDLSITLDTGSIEVHSTGAGAEALPTDESNLIARVILEHAPELRARGFHVHTHSDIPLTRGFGSSATAIVGALGLVQLTRGEAIDRQKILQISTEKEGHPDNVSASIFGGLTVNASLADAVHTHVVRIPSSIEIVGVIPHQKISTTAARDALPERYDRADIVYNLQRLAWLITGLYEEDHSMIGAGLNDKLHQDYRCALLPPMRQAIDAMKAHDQCIGAFVSGAGPAMVAFTSGNAQEVGQVGAALFRERGIEAAVRVLKPDNDGIVRR